MSVCRSCSASIIWTIEAKTGKRQPIDAEPVENGNIEIVGERADQYGSSPVVRHVPPGDALPGMEPVARYVSHFATCPHANIHRANSQSTTEKGST